MKKLEYSKYASTQEKIRKTASDMMQKWVDKNGVEDRQKAIQFAKALSDKYGEAAASYACDMYDAIATSQKAKVPPAVPADTASWEEVGKAINGSLKQSIDGNLISGVVERLVKQAGEDTMLHNAARDRAEFAWIPDGGACAFCIMLASRGWQRASKDLLNSHAEHIHANCGCEFAIRFDKNSGVKGYNPDILKKMYDEIAPGKNANIKLRELRAKLLQKTGNKVMITEQAVDKVGAIGPKGYSDDILNNMQNMNKTILNTSMNDNDSNEVAMIMNMAGELSKALFGDTYNVEIQNDPDFSSLLRSSPLRSLIVSHNHPGLSYFSADDFGVFMMYPSIDTIEVVTNQGKTWFISKKENYDDQKVLDIYHEIVDNSNGKSKDDVMDEILLKISKYIERN